MGIFKKRETIVSSETVTDPLLTALLRGEEINRASALELPAVSKCVDKIGNTFAMIPFKLYKEEIVDGKKVTKEVEDARVNLINDDTTDTLDGFQFKKAICEDYLMGKGGYAYINKKNNKYLGLFYVQDTKVTIAKNTDAIFKKYNFLVDAKPYQSHEFIKLLRNTKDGASGIGLTTEIARTLKTAYQRLLYDHDLAVTGGSRKGFIKSQKHLDAKAMETLKNAWEQYYNGTANTVILNDGLEFQEASNSSRENEIDTKNKTFAGDMNELFHMGKNEDEFIKNAVMPIAIAFATALNRDLLLEKEKKDHYFAPDTKELLKGSLKERYEAYQIAIKNGFKTRNEIRYMEDDDAIEGLDMINLGLGDVLLNAKTGEIYTPNTNKMVKMGENTQDNVNNVGNPPSNKPNNENVGDLEENRPNTQENEKVAENEEKSPKKGGVNDESRN